MIIAGKRKTSLEKKLRIDSHVLAPVRTAVNTHVALCSLLGEPT